VSPTAFTGGLPVLPIVVGLVLLTLGTLGAVLGRKRVRE